MGNRSREVEAHMKSEAFSGRGKRVKKDFDREEIEEGKKISAEERDRVLNIARQIIETGKGDLLDEEGEKILKEIGGVYFSAYKKAIEFLYNKKLGGNENER